MMIDNGGRDVVNQLGKMAGHIALVIWPLWLAVWLTGHIAKTLWPYGQAYLNAVGHMCKLLKIEATPVCTYIYILVSTYIP